jgi:hypothetical protein
MHVDNEPDNEMSLTITIVTNKPVLLVILTILVQSNPRTPCKDCIPCTPWKPCNPCNPRSSHCQYAGVDAATMPVTVRCQSSVDIPQYVGVHARGHPRVGEATMPESMPLSKQIINLHPFSGLGLIFGLLLHVNVRSRSKSLLRFTREHSLLLSIRHCAVCTARERG